MVEGIAIDEIVEKDSMGMLSYRGLTYVVIIVMSFLLPVVIINLFIGLAVGDIEKIRENTLYIKTTSDCSIFFCGSHCLLFAPHSVNRKFIIVNPNKHKCFTNKWLRWVWVMWQSSTVSLAENNIEEADKYVEQELRISKMQATMMEMENQLQMLMEQQQKQMEITNKYFVTS